MKKSTEYIHIRVRPDEKRRLEQVCKDWDMSISECVRTLVDLAYLSNNREPSSSSAESYTFLGRH